jgi:hypothetical protein
MSVPRLYKSDRIRSRQLRVVVVVVVVAAAAASREQASSKLQEYRRVQEVSL